MQKSATNQRHRKSGSRLSPKSKLVRVVVRLPSAERGVYFSAARLLKQIMGSQAPTTHAIMRAQIGGRSAADIVDGHLDSVNWLHEDAEPNAGTSSLSKDEERRDKEPKKSLACTHVIGRQAAADLVVPVGFSEAAQLRKSPPSPA